MEGSKKRRREGKWGMYPVKPITANGGGRIVTLQWRPQEHVCWLAWSNAMPCPAYHQLLVAVSRFTPWGWQGQPSAPGCQCPGLQEGEYYDHYYASNQERRVRKSLDSLSRSASLDSPHGQAGHLTAHHQIRKALGWPDWSGPVVGWSWWCSQTIDRNRISLPFPDTHSA